MEAVFLKLISMSLSASWLVLAILGVRLLLRKTPRWILCLLWALVAVRLLCPVTPESAFSMMPAAGWIPEEAAVEEFYAHAQIPQIDSEAGTGMILESDGTLILEKPLEPGEFTAMESTARWVSVGSTVWCLGVLAMLGYLTASYLLLKNKVASAIPLEKGIRQSEYVDTPFVLGLFRPVIYLPFGMAGEDLSYVLAHEKAHIRRKDHLWKPLGFLLLSLHWFNPLMWLAYILLCRDIEGACDEKVIRHMDKEGRRAYSAALLNCSIHRKRIAACPLAFGETGVKTRVRGIMHYKKPAFWVILGALVVCVVLAVGFLTDPAAMHLYEIDDSRNYSDLLTNTDPITLIREGEEYPAPDPEAVLEALDRVTVRPTPMGRSRSEARDKTNRVRLREKLYLNFSWDYTRVWIDNLVKPTYTYRVNEPGIVREIFQQKEDGPLQVRAEDVTPEGMTLVYSPKEVYDSNDIAQDFDYWLEVWDGSTWKALEKQEDVRIRVSMKAKEQQRQSLSWRDTYGALGPGQYRLAANLYFRQEDTARNLYANFTLEADRLLGITVMNGKLVSLSDGETITSMRSALQNLREQVLPAEAQVLKTAQAEDFDVVQIIVSYVQGDKILWFSEDFSLVWEEGSTEGYVIPDPEPLRSLVERLTDAVRNRETDGEPFASADAPWDWTAGIHSGAVKTAQAHVCLFRSGGYARSTNGAISYDTLESLMEVLNQIPKDAFTPGKLTQKQGYHRLFVNQQVENCAISLEDGVNGIAVILRCQDDKLEMILTEELDKVDKEDGTYLEPTQIWQVEDPALLEFMQQLQAHPTVINYFVGGEYDWQAPISITAGEVSLSLRIPEGWEYENVTEEQHSGIRCRPAEQTEGWLYFSYWPHEYAPAEEDRYVDDSGLVGNNVTVYTSYPSEVKTPTSFLTEGYTWSYKRYDLEVGDYAVINEGADQWFLEYQDMIEDMVLLAAVSME